MKPINIGGHSAYQNRVLIQLRKYYPDAFKITSYTRFAADLKENHLHAIISGFTVGDTPGIGTFYDFHKHLWLSGDKNISNPLHPPKQKPSKPKGKEEKAAPVEKVTVEDLFRQFEDSPPSDHLMKQAVVDPKKRRVKYRCPKITCKGGSPHCLCENPCSDAEYGRNVHLVLKDKSKTI